MVDPAVGFIWFLAFLFSTTVHEAMHAWAAMKGGDLTAYHGGQVSLPVVGPVAAHKFPVAHGARTDGETTLFVSRGVGTVLVPCRIDCPPEVALLTLRRVAAGVTA